MSVENYLNHPSFGLLFRICVTDSNSELFATLYAQRLFFVVMSGPNGMQFEPLSRSDAKMLVENRLRTLRRLGDAQQYEQIQKVYQQTFQ